MRYPVYFFLLLTGYFYLTGKPLDDKAGQKPVAEVENRETRLKYAEKTAEVVSRTIADSSTKSQTVIKKQPGQGGRQTTAKAVVVAAAEPVKPVEKNAPAAKPVIVANDNLHWLTITKPAGKRVPIAMAPGKWRTGSLMADTGTSSSNETAAMPEPQMAGRPGLVGKKLDWTVFGNGRDKTAGRAMTPPPGMPAQDVADAERIPAGAVDPVYNAGVKSKRVRARRAGRKVYRKRLAARKRVARKKRKFRRYARLKRRSRGAYRIARRSPKKTRRKLRRSGRKRFGFTTHAGVMSLGGF